MTALTITDSMETKESQTKKRGFTFGGSLVLPLDAAMNFIGSKTKERLSTPPVSHDGRVCNEHFVNEDYVEERVFESGVLVVHRTNKLKSEAVPSVFDFSSYEVGCTERPTQSTSQEVAGRRKERDKQRAYLAEQREVINEQQHIGLLITICAASPQS